jgi:hypothetical protein
MNQDTIMMGWRHSILSRLDEERPTSVASHAERVRWLAAHLDEYVERWIGFVEHPVMVEGPTSQAFESDQFAIIGLAIELIGQELREQGIGDPGAARWNRLEQAHRDLQSSRDLGRRGELRTASSDFLAHMTSIA